MALLRHRAASGPGLEKQVQDLQRWSRRFGFLTASEPGTLRLAFYQKLRQRDLRGEPNCCLSLASSVPFSSTGGIPSLCA